MGRAKVRGVTGGCGCAMGWGAMAVQSKPARGLRD